MKHINYYSKKRPSYSRQMFKLRSSQLMYINIWHSINYTGKMRKSECKIIKIIVYIISYTRDLLIISANFNSFIGQELNEACNFPDLVQLKYIQLYIKIKNYAYIVSLNHPILEYISSSILLTLIPSTYINNEYDLNPLFKQFNVKPPKT